MRILFLTHRLPYAPNRGDRIRAYHMLREMARFAEVDLVSLVHDADEAGRGGDLAGLAATVQVARVPALRNRAAAVCRLPGGRPLTHLLLDSPAVRPAVARVMRRSPPDVVVAYGSGMARFALEPPLAAVPRVVDLIDVDSAKWARLAESARFPLSAIYRREARILGAFEREIVARASATFVVNQRERALLDEPDNVVVLEIGIDRPYYAAPSEPPPRRGVVVTGVFDYQPNAEGALWLVHEVWPLVRARRPDMTLTLAGANPTGPLKAAAGKDPSITVTGSVPDIRPYLWRAELGAAPIHIARGVQNKVLEGVAAGLPFVATRAVFDGLPAAVRPAVTVADTPAAFADAILTSVSDPGTGRAVVASLSLDSLSWASTLAPLEGILRAASLRS